LIAALRGGEIDFLLGALRDRAPHPELRQEYLFDDELAIGMRAAHPLASKKKATARALAEFPWIAPRRGSPLRGHYDRLFKSAAIAPPQGAIECNSLGAARSLLLLSDRVMLLSKQQIRYELEAGLLAALPHPNGKVVRAIGMTVRRTWMPTESQKQLVSLLKEHAQRK
jgi:DNA-binding transcriptional LysR family regulator